MPTPYPNQPGSAAGFCAATSRLISRVSPSSFARMRSVPSPFGANAAAMPSSIAIGSTNPSL